MKKTYCAMIILIMVLMLPYESKSFAPKGKKFGVGIILGEPTGLTAKYWTTNDNAFDFSLGNSYLGTLRLGVDYLFHFNAFNSNVTSIYAGPGIAIGFGRSSGVLYNNQGKAWYRSDDNVGLGTRGLVGVNIIPKKTSIEFFGELGVLVGFNPTTYTNVEGAIGLRYYF